MLTDPEVGIGPARPISKVKGIGSERLCRLPMLGPQNCAQSLQRWLPVPLRWFTEHSTYIDSGTGPYSDRSSGALKTS